MLLFKFHAQLLSAMKLFFLIGHENPKSLSHSLMVHAKKNLEAENHEVIISDLYAQGFNPVGGKRDFLFKADDEIHYLGMQEKASLEKKFAPDITAEMRKICLSDALIIFFPLWWYSYPAIIKGWFDRVLANGFAYGGAGGSYEMGNLGGKAASAVITVDGTKENFSPAGKYKQVISETLYPLMHGTLRYTGFRTLDPLLIYESSKMDLRRYKDALDDLDIFLARFIKMIMKKHTC